MTKIKQSELDTVFKIMPEGLLLVDFDAKVLKFNTVIGSLLPDVDFTQESFGDVFSCEHGGDHQCGTTAHCINCNVRNGLKQVQEKCEPLHQVIFNHGFRYGNDIRYYRLKMNFVPLAMGQNDVILITVNPVSLELMKKLIDVEELDYSHPFMDIIRDIDKNEYLEKSIAVLSHEVSHPLGDVKLGSSYIDGLVMELKSDFEKDLLTKEKFSSKIQMIAEASKQMNMNVVEATEYLKVYRQMVLDDMSDEVSTINVNSQLDRLLKSMKQSLRRSNVSVNIDIKNPLEIKSQTSIFNSIFRNLIQNSIVHGFDDISSPAITIEGKPQGANIIFDYYDNGIGIPEENMEAIFQLKFTTGGENSSGIGLDFVKYLIERKLKGNIKLLRSNDGVHFRIEIPRT